MFCALHLLVMYKNTFVQTFPNFFCSILIHLIIFDKILNCHDKMKKYIKIHEECSNILFINIFKGGGRTVYFVQN